MRAGGDGGDAVSVRPSLSPTDPSYAPFTVLTTTYARRAEMITGLYSALVDRGLQDRIGILADESSSLSRATGEYADWLPQVIDMVRSNLSCKAYLWMVN